MWSTNQRVVRTTNINNIANQMLLPVVRSQDGYLMSWIANQSHVHVNSHAVFGFS